MPFKALSDQVLHYKSMFSHFENWILYLWFLYKSDWRISCFRNDGKMKVSKVHRTYHSINGRSLLPLYKSSIKKALINTACSVNISLISLFIILQYVSILCKCRYFLETFPSIFFIIPWSLHHSMKRDCLMSSLKKKLFYYLIY